MHTTYTRFVAYGSETYLPLLGELKVTMRNVRGKEIATTVYVIKSQGESLLGKEDARALGILSTDQEGGSPPTVNQNGGSGGLFPFFCCEYFKNYL